MDRFLKNNNTRTKKEDDLTGAAKETDPLIHASSHSSSGKGSNSSNSNSRSGNVLRSRRSASQSPIIEQQIYSSNSTGYLSIHDNIRPMISGNFDDITNDADDVSRNRIHSLAAVGDSAPSCDMGDADNVNDGYQSIEESLSSIQSRRVQRLEQQRQPDGQSPVNDYIDANSGVITSTIRTNSSLGSAAPLLEKNIPIQDNNAVVQKSSTLSSTSSRRRQQVSEMHRSTDFLIQTNSKGGSVSLSESIRDAESATTTRSSLRPQDNADYGDEQQQHIEQQRYSRQQEQQQEVDRDMPSDSDNSNDQQRQRQFQQRQSRSTKQTATATVPVGVSATKSSSYSTDKNDNVVPISEFRKGSRDLTKYQNVNNNNDHPNNDNPSLVPNGGGVGGGGGGGMIVGTGDGRSFDSEQPPLLEIPEEVYAVRKAALQVLKPLNKTWVVISVGFSLTVLFGMARWSQLLPMIPYWFIVLPCWSAHVGLFWLHVLSARALSAFIAEANESRQRPDSRDHLNRTEYLPLLQRSLKFGFKTGLLSFCMFLFEILIYIRVARGSVSLGVAFIPLWLLILCGILDGLICKSQHTLRVSCWILTFICMVLTVIKVDYNTDAISWTIVASPIIFVLTIASASLVYIVYGHQIGFYRLTEAQLTAGNLYSLAALICIVLIVMIAEVIPLSTPVEVETRLFVVILAPLVVCLVGMGAWVISRDEFGRLLLYGGQSAVHPMKLRWEESKGWTSFQGRGVTVIPMFGEVSFQPLERKRLLHSFSNNNNSNNSNPNNNNRSNDQQQQQHKKSSTIELLSCCTRCTLGCYPTEEDESNNSGGGSNANVNNNIMDNDEKQHLTEDIGYHPYLDSSDYRVTHRTSSYHHHNNINILPSYNVRPP